MRARSFCSVVLVIAPAVLVAANITTAPSSPRYRPPTDAVVSEPFRAPAGPYGAGNRGLDYSTRPGSAVRAIGDGTVVFAGPVAGQLYVTVLHPDGLRSSYSYLAAIDVTLGQSVVIGAQIGVAGDRLQLGVRRGDTYIDPATLFRPRRPHLVRRPRRDGSRGR